MITYFFGWTNIKRLIKELVKIYSHEPSFFSKKRIESGTAFIILQWAMVYYLIEKISILPMTDFLIWAGVELAICGYTLNKIQEEKKDK